MIGFLLSLLQESPLLFAVLVINIVVVAYIVIRIGLYVAYQKSPGRTLSRLLWKLRTRKEKGEIKTVEDLYAHVIDGLKKEGVLSKGDKYGLASRQRALNTLPEGKKRQILKELFGLYESKVYGKRRVSNEGKTVSDILNRYDSL